eukprot:4279682-Pleurochrysis_carterae.AAC.1
MSRSSTGVGTGSASATPVKSSMYTCKKLGCACSPPSLPPSRASARRAIHLRAACGGGCASSNCACDA